MPNQADVERYLGPDVHKPFEDAFLNQFSGVDAKAHAEALRKLKIAEARVTDLEAEVEEIKRFYQAKLEARNGTEQG